MYICCSKYFIIYLITLIMSTKNIHKSIPGTFIMRHSRASVLALKGWVVLYSNNYFLNFLGVSKNVSTLLQNLCLWVWLFCASFKLLLPGHKNMKNVSANVCNLWIKFKLVTIHKKYLTCSWKTGMTSLIHINTLPCNILISIFPTKFKFPKLRNNNLKSRNDVVSCHWWFFPWYRNWW